MHYDFETFIAVMDRKFTGKFVTSLPNSVNRLKYGNFKQTVEPSQAKLKCDIYLRNNILPFGESNVGG